MKHRIGFIIVAATITFIFGTIIYSRGFAERQKPFVYIGFHNSDSFFWEYNTESRLELASEEFAHRGSWMLYATFPRAAFENYMDDIPELIVHVISENVASEEQVEVARVEPLENGDYLLTLIYTAPVRTTRKLAGRIHGQEVWIGERHEIIIRSAVPTTAHYLLPATAVHQDEQTGEHYILSVTRQSTAFGRKYTAVRHDVEVLRMLRGMFSLADMPTNSPLILQAQGEVYDGAVIRIFD